MSVDEKINQIENSLRNQAKLIKPWPSDFHVTFHTACANAVTIDGLWLEFGVYRGRSIDQFASLTEKTIYGFDSFEGLPEFWDKDNPQGVYGLAGNIPAGVIVGENQSMYDTTTTQNFKPWPKNVQLIKGWFNETLPGFLRDHKDNVALLHVDSDLYSSAKTVLDNLVSQIVPGTIIIFDEIDNYPDYRDHEIKAFAEFLLQTEYNYEALFYSGYDYSQGCFRIK